MNKIVGDAIRGYEVDVWASFTDERREWGRVNGNWFYKSSLSFFDSVNVFNQMGDQARDAYSRRGWTKDVKAVLSSLWFLERKQHERRIDSEEAFLVEERIWAEKVSLLSTKVVECSN